MDFKLNAPFKPTGDQPEAIRQLVDGIQRGYQQQVLLGATGTGKTFTIAAVIEQLQKPALVMAHNKTLAAQLYAEFKEFFPENAVEYFVSYYDYYQPEAYVPRNDLYIEKDADINEEIERLRLAATTSLMSRKDVIIVASVSCIYGIGNPEAYGRVVINLESGNIYRRNALLRHLIESHYERNDLELRPGTFRVRGDTLEVIPAYQDNLGYRITFFGDEVERLVEFDALTGELRRQLDTIAIYPAKHFITDQEKLQQAIVDIEAELQERVAWLKSQDRLLEAQRLEQRTLYDLEMLREVGYCSGIENYSRHMDQRPAGTSPWTLMDYLPSDYLLILDESHMTVPQIRGMYNGDRSRKETLVEYGFRLPSALDNRPLTFEEFKKRMGYTVYTSATPAPYEMGQAEQVVEQIIRPTGLVDPEVEVRPIEGQVDDLLKEIRRRVEVGQRTLVTTLTKRMAEKLADYLMELGVKVHYLHSEVETLERVGILRDLRLGVFDVVVGHQPAARRARPAGGLPGRHPGRRQRGLPALGDRPDPDHRARRPPCRRAGDHVRRPHHQFHAPRHRRDQPPPPKADGLQHAARHPAGQHLQSGARPDRPALGARRRRVARRVPGEGSCPPAGIGHPARDPGAGKTNERVCQEPGIREGSRPARPDLRAARRPG